MALSIEKGYALTKVSIPLHAGDDKEMRDNTWLVEHLRQLANHIEETNPKIYKIGLGFSKQYGASMNIEHF
jgi:hypothetical protein